MRGQITIFKISKGASKLYAKHATSMQSMLMLGGLGACPQVNLGSHRPFGYYIKSLINIVDQELLDFQFI